MIKRQSSLGGRLDAEGPVLGGGSHSAAVVGRERILTTGPNMNVRWKRRFGTADLSYRLELLAALAALERH